MATADYWYEITTADTFRQGDILRDICVCPLPQDLDVPTDPPAKDKPLELEAEWDRSTWILMSASCDLDRGPTAYPYALLGRVIEATKANLNIPDDKTFNAVMEVARRGDDRSKFLLPGHPEWQPPFPLSIVQSKVHLTMPLGYLGRVCVGPRLRLRHPFREMFGAWVGGNLSRIGPEDVSLVPRFVAKLPPTDVLRALDGADDLK